MSEVVIGILALVLLLILFAAGMEIGFSMAFVGFIGYVYLSSFKSALNLLGRDFFDVISAYGYTVFPLFVLMGQIAFNAGLASKLYEAANKFLGHISGGLAMATVAGATGFKAMCGSSTATAATFASVAIPEMDKFGYDKKLSTGIVSSVGTLGCIIPPSVTLIIYGMITEQSIGKLFLAGMIPGLMIAFFFLIIIFGWARINPAIAPKAPRANWNERIAVLPSVFWVALIFLVVVGGIMAGYFTPTEAGSIGAFAIFLLSFLRRDLNFKSFVKSLKESLLTASMILMLLAGSTILSHFITTTNIPKVTAEWITSLPLNRNIIMVIICMIYLIGGSFIEDLAFMVFVTPIFYPAVLKMGFDPIWFGILIAITIMVGVVIPPVAVCVFVVGNITKVPLGTIYKGVVPFLLSFLVAAFLLFVFPDLALWLPRVID